MAIEDAVNTRTRLGRGSLDEPPPAADQPGAQEMPSDIHSKVFPPKFVTPATPRKARSSKPFPAVSSLDSRFTESEIQTSIENGGESSSQTQSHNASPWKTTPTEMEGWTPKTRKRG
jgi:hypothetical protein